MADIMLVVRDETIALTNKISPSEVNQNQIVDLTFTNIQYSVGVPNPNSSKNGSKIIQRKILNNVSGFCPGGQVTAILGSSGAGKTSLLNILARRLGKSANVVLSGELMANNKPYDGEKFASFASYIMQDDVLFTTLTPREALQFAANLKFKDSNYKELRVRETIKNLKLEKCQHTLIGGVLLKGISGGERKRTSIGFELVSDPQVILLDEPTSGLDSFTAFSIINLLRDICKAKNKTVVFTIHQPSTDIYQLFDRILLLVEGQFIYQGPRPNMINYFTQMGFKCPQYSNPMDYLMSIMHSESNENVKNYAIYFNTYKEKLIATVGLEIQNSNTGSISSRETETTFFYQVQQIMARAFLNIKRDKLLVTGRLAQAMFMGLLLGGIFFGVASNHNGLRAMQSTAGVLFFSCMVHLMGSINPVIIQFPAERAVFLREENSKLYSAGAYFIGKSSVELPFIILIPIIQQLISYWMVKYNDQTAQIIVLHLFILALLSAVGNSIGLIGGCLFQDVKVASGVVPLFIMPLILFSGFFKNQGNFMNWIGWFQYLSPVKYAFEAVMRNNYTDVISDTNPIQTYAFDIGLWNSIYALLGFIVAYRVIAYLLLVSLKSKMQ